MSDSVKKITVLVVDDSMVMRRILATALAKDSEIKVVGFAANGEEAIEAVKTLKPQAVTLDIEMPVMDGITALKEIRKFEPRLPIVVLSTLTQVGARAAIEALLSGASDYVGKPSYGASIDDTFEVLSQAVIPKIKALVRRRQISSHKGDDNDDASKKTTANKPVLIRPSNASVAAPEYKSHAINALCIGVSTGGPAALVQLFETLKAPLSFPIFVVQHMPPVFTSALAKRLNAIGNLPIVEAHHEQDVSSGHVYLAPGDHHMNLKRTHMGKIVITLEQTPPENSCRPSVDVLFRSVAATYGANSLAIILTGMGQDGLKGVAEIAAAGGVICVQDEDTSVVWGMPGAVMRAGLADRVLPLSQIAQEISGYSVPMSRAT